MVVKEHHHMIIMIDCAVGGIVFCITQMIRQEGYVKGVVMYTIMDDLTVTPMSTISIIAMLHEFNLGQVESLEEKVGLELLKSIARVENCAYCQL
ncbi:hypothetical protein Gogos_003859, partial [Gossypium gossypioides]|nr:hypothetical protein [Gossypium gossypioides]